MGRPSAANPARPRNTGAANWPEAVMRLTELTAEAWQPAFRICLVLTATGIIAAVAAIAGVACWWLIHAH
jgi:hypothetical protein